MIQTSVLANLHSAKRRKLAVDNLAVKTTEAFSKANIPLEKLDDPNLREWMNEFIEGAGDLPCVRSLRETYVPVIAQAHFDEIKQLAQHKCVDILCDETTDSKGRCVFVVLFKIQSNSLTDPVVKVAAVNILEKADATTCSQAILECINKYSVNFMDIQAIVTDAARYMTKCVTSLQVLFGEHVAHVQCWPHKLAMVGNSIGLKEVNEAVVKAKTAFLNTRKRKHHYLQYLSEHTTKAANLFPMPVKTRWNSWFRAVFYLAEYLVDIVNFFKLDEMKAINNSGIHYVAGVSEKDVAIILAQCIFVKTHAADIVSLLTKLEGSQYPTAHSLYGYLSDLLKGFEGTSKGVFDSPFETFMSESSLTTSDKAQVKHKCQNSSALAMTKLQSLMNSDPSAHIFKAISKLFSPKNILLNETKSVLSVFDNIPAFIGVDNSVRYKGYEFLKEAVQDAVKRENEPDVAKLLMALGVEHEVFTKAALKAIWLPTNNVDSERLLSHYNLVVTDRRQNLKEENIETFTMLSFDS